MPDVVYPPATDPIAAHPGGGVVVAGTTWGGEGASGGGEWDYATLRYGAGGALLWQETFDATTWSESATSVAVAPSGEVVVAGGGWRLDYTVLEYAGDGTRLRELYYDGPGHNSDVALDVLVARDGRIAATGLSVGVKHNFDMATVMFDE